MLSAEPPWGPPSGAAPAPPAPPAPPQLPGPGWLPEAQSGQLRVYAQGLRGPRYRWWRSLVSLGIVFVAFVGISIASGVALVIAALVSGQGLDQVAVWSRQLADSKFSLIDLVANNAILAALIPIAVLGAWAGHRVRPGTLSSVAGRLRWSWLLIAAGVSAVVFVPVIGGLSLLDGTLTSGAHAERQWLALSLVVVISTPLQAAGEEYFFRGWLTQAVGAWFSRPVVASLVGGLFSATLFALAHGGQDPWLFADRFMFGLVASWLVYRTGGLEASIAMHAVNNMTSFAVAIPTGQLSATVLSTSQAPAATIFDLVLQLVVAAAITLLARRRGLVNTFPPDAPPPQSGWSQGAPAAVGYPHPGPYGVSPYGPPPGPYGSPPPGPYGPPPGQYGPPPQT